MVILSLVSFTFPSTRPSPNRIMQIIPSCKLQKARVQGEVWAVQVPMIKWASLGWEEIKTTISEELHSAPRFSEEEFELMGGCCSAQTWALKWTWPSFAFPQGTQSPALKSTPNGKVPSCYVHSWLNSISLVQIRILFVKQFLHDASVNCSIDGYAWRLPFSFLL